APGHRRRLRAGAAARLDGRHAGVPRPLRPPARRRRARGHGPRPRRLARRARVARAAQRHPRALAALRARTEPGGARLAVLARTAPQPSAPRGLRRPLLRLEPTQRRTAAQLGQLPLSRTGQLL
ncbi:MAG: hypothetical protein AVDCRST_MAG40-1811, partial [uncultured Gemmatimonadaceae bacterium]